MIPWHKRLIFSSCHRLKLSHNTACIYHCSKCLKARKTNSWVRDLPLHLPTLFSLLRIYMKQQRQFLAVYSHYHKIQAKPSFQYFQIFLLKRHVYIFSNVFFSKGLMLLVYRKAKVFYLSFSTHLSTQGYI